MACPEVGKTKDIDPSKLSLTTTSYISQGGGWVGGIGNKAQLRPAKLELGLGLSSAKISIYEISLKIIL